MRACRPSRAAFFIIFDIFCAPLLGRCCAELRHVRACLATDAAYVRMHRSMLRCHPEKGIVRLVLALSWLTLHLYAFIVFALYGAFAANPAHATWWFWSTGTSGIMYVLLMYSDPGFVQHEELKQLSKRAGLDVDIVGSDIGRGLLQDVVLEMAFMPSLPLPDDGDIEAAVRTGIGNSAGPDEANATDGSHDGSRSRSAADARGGCTEHSETVLRMNNHGAGADELALDKSRGAGFWADRSEASADAHLREEPEHPDQVSSSVLPAPPYGTPPHSWSVATTWACEGGSAVCGEALADDTQCMSEEHPPRAAAVVLPNMDCLAWEDAIAGGVELTAVRKAAPAMAATAAAASTSSSRVAPEACFRLDSRGSWRCADAANVHRRSLIAKARTRLDSVGGIDGVGYDLRSKDAACEGAQLMRWSTNTDEHQHRSDVDDNGKDGQEGGADSGPRVRELAATLACNPRIVGYDESGAEEMAIAAMRQAECGSLSCTPALDPTSHQIRCHYQADARYSFP